MEEIKKIARMAGVAAAPETAGAVAGTYILIGIFVIIAFFTFAYGHWIVGGTFMILAIGTYFALNYVKTFLPF